VENEQKPTKKDTLDAFSALSRAIVRPVVTILFAAVIAHAVTTGLVLPDWFLGLSIPLITFWFGERAYTHHAERRARDD
jgi:uncharacterized membrane protein YdbT with pleckstrin-like domain